MARSNEVCDFLKFQASFQKIPQNCKAHTRTVADKIFVRCRLPRLLSIHLTPTALWQKLGLKCCISTACFSSYFVTPCISFSHLYAQKHSCLASCYGTTS